MKRTTLIHGMLSAVTLLATLTFTTAHADEKGDATKGQALYAVCAGCHGADGMGLEGANGPRLQGQHDWYLVRQLQHYQNGARGTHKDDTYGATMRAMAGTLASEQAILDVVAYIGTLEAK